MRDIDAGPQPRREDYEYYELQSGRMVKAKRRKCE
jgi:hypothetical protein